MDLKQIRQLVAVIDSGSIMRAAEVLNITQPALTRSIHNLEYSVGSKLLERSARGVVPTDYGRLLYDRGRSLLTEADKLKSDLNRLRTGKAGTLAVGVSRLCEDWMTAPIADFAAANPEIELDVRVGFFDELAAKLLTAEIDLVISIIPTFFRSNEFTIEKLGELRSSFVVRTGHHLIGVGPIAATSLASLSWAVFDVPNTTRFFEEHFFKRGLGLPKVQLRSNSIAMVKQTLLTTESVSVLPDHLTREEFEAGYLARLDTGFGKVCNQFCIAYTSAVRRSAATQKLLASLKTLAQDHRWD